MAAKNPYSYDFEFFASQMPLVGFGERPELKVPSEVMVTLTATDAGYSVGISLGVGSYRQTRVAKLTSNLPDAVQVVQALSRDYSAARKKQLALDKAAAKVPTKSETMDEVATISGYARQGRNLTDEYRARYKAALNRIDHIATTASAHHTYDALKKISEIVDDAVG